MHGERNETTPARKASGKETWTSSIWLCTRDDSAGPSAA
jgi:hypothetical protein